MPMIMPPKEILKNVRCRNNSVYLVGEVTEEQKDFSQVQKRSGKHFKKVGLKHDQLLKMIHVLRIKTEYYKKHLNEVLFSYLNIS